MLRTALGESTASLDSAGRSAQCPCVLGGRGGQLWGQTRGSPPRPSLCWEAEPCACGCGWGVSPRSDQGRAPSRPGGHPGASGRCSVMGATSCPLAVALSPPSPSRDEGGQKLSVCSGPARGGLGEPDSSFLPRNGKKPPGECPMRPPVRPPTLPPSGERAALRGPEVGSQSGSKGPHGLQMPGRKPAPPEPALVHHRPRLGLRQRAVPGRAEQLVRLLTLVRQRGRQGGGRGQMGPSPGPCPQHPQR